MSKNKKTFIYIVQSGKSAGARIYRVMRNKPVLLGFAGYRCTAHQEHVKKWLIRKGYISPHHQLGENYSLKAV